MMSQIFSFALVRRSKTRITPTIVRKGVKLYEFKIVLRNTRPAVERRIVVAGNYTLQELGRIAISAIGMATCKFDLWGPDGESIRGNDPFNADSDTDSDSNTNSTKTEKKRKSENLMISKFFNLQEKNKIVLDYGQDGWRYVITLIKIRERDFKLYPQCISGKNACPPEDVGGPEGYKDLLRTIKDPKHKEYNDSKDWLTSMGYKNFDPKEFTVSSVKFGT